MLLIWFCKKKFHTNYLKMNKNPFTDVILDSSVANGASAINIDNPTFTFLPPIDDVVGITIMSCQIPYSYYVVDNTNNQFIITITGSTLAGGTDFNGGVYTITVPVGTYNSTTLPQMLTYCFETAAQITKTGGTGTAVALGTTMDMKAFYDTTLSKTLFYINGVNYKGNVPFSVSFPTATSMAEVLGYLGSSASASTASSTGLIYDNQDIVLAGGSSTNYVYSPFSAQLSGGNYIYVHSDLASNTHQSIRNATSNQDIIAAIPVNNNYTGTIDYINNTPRPISFSKTSISKINLFLTLGNRTSFNTGNGAKNYLELQGQPFFIVLRFERLDPTQSSMVSNGRNGDSYTTTDSMQTSSRTPSEQTFSRQQVVPGKRRKTF